MGIAPRPDEFAPPGGLSALLAELLPEPWRRELRATCIPDGFIVRFRDGDGREHGFEARRLIPGGQAYRTGQELGLSLGSLPEGDPARWLGQYEPVLARLLSREVELSAFLGAAPRSRPAEGAPGAAGPESAPVETTVFLTEQDLRAQLIQRWGKDGGRAGLRRLLDERIPPGTRGRVILYFETRCLQACQFCQQPAIRDTPPELQRDAVLRARLATGDDFVGLGFLDGLLEAAGARDPPLSLTILGHDWAQHPELPRILARLERERRVEVSLEGPSTRLADPALAERVAALPTLGRITLTLTSSDPRRHDRIVGREGAGDEVLKAIENLQRIGAPLRVNVVLTADAVETLPALLRWLDGRGLPAALLGFIPDDAPGWDPAPVVARMDRIRDALEAEIAPAERAVQSLFGLPPCAVPPPLRARTHQAWQSEQHPFGFAPACDHCRLRPGCRGVPAVYLRRFGETGLAPE